MNPQIPQIRTIKTKAPVGQISRWEKKYKAASAHWRRNAFERRNARKAMKWATVADKYATLFVGW